MNRIYFDNAATTRVDERVISSMLPFLSGSYGNPSSLHMDGRNVRHAIEEARASVAVLINAAPDEIIFTSSGTEADNLALFGVVENLPENKKSVLVSAFEHPAVGDAVDALAKKGYSVKVVRPDGQGIVKPDLVDLAMDGSIGLVSIMMANNVVGTIQPVEELSAVVRRHGALFHSDAVQAVGKIPVDVQRQGIDMLSISAHKIHGPKGVGALYVRKGIRISPLLRGGGQERGLRSSTENVPGIVGLGEAAKICRDELAANAAIMVAYRDRIIDEISGRIPSCYLIGHRYMRLPGHVCFGFSGSEGEAIKLLLDLDNAGFSVSTGSACSSGHAHQPSHVLLSMGFDPFKARGSLRVTLSHFTTDEEVDDFISKLPEAVKGLRKITSCS